MSGSKKKDETSNGKESSDDLEAKSHMEKSIELTRILVDAIPEGCSSMHVSIAAAMLSSVCAIEAGLSMDKFITQCVALYNYNKDTRGKDDN